MLPKKFDSDLYKSILLRRKWYVIVTFCLILCAGTSYAIVKPRMYKASTLILVQSQKVPSNYVQSTVTTDLSDRINTITQQVTSRTNLESIIKEYKLYEETDNSGPEMTTQEKVELARENISIEVHRGSAFSIAFIGGQPQKIAAVANNLASNFIEENLRVREDQSVGTTQFLQSELARIHGILEQKEGALTSYKQEHMGGLPDDLGTNVKIMEQLGLKVASIERSLDEARTQKIILQQQITGLRNLSGSTSGDVLASQNGMAPAPQLQQLENELSSLRLRYKENHPDVVKTKKMIEKITEQQEVEEQQPAADGEHALAGSTITSGGDDIYTKQLQSVEFQISSTEETIKTFQSNKAKLENEISVLQKRIEGTPQRQLELIAIQRDYDTIERQYHSLLEKKLDSELAGNMEKRQKGEQFKIIDPAKPPEKPFSPNIPKIILASVIFGLAAGFSLALGTEYLDQSFRDYNELTEVLQIPLLAVIPRLQTAADARRNKRVRLIGYCLSGCLIAAVGVTIWLWVNGDLGELAQKLRSLV